jgi:hypothetical protein
LVAETTPGVGAVACERLRVRCSELGDTRTYRVVVQSYRCVDMGEEAPTRAARPLGSAQRTVDGQSLREGVDINVVHPSTDSETLIVAWVEAGGTELEFDGRRARPRANCPSGVARGGRGRRAEVVLKRHARPEATDAVAA